MNTGNFYKTAAISKAIQYGWEYSYEKMPGIVGFRHKFLRCHMDVYINAQRVVTCMVHPKGTTVLLRENIGMHELAEIMRDPGIHTNKGKKI